MLPIFLVLFEFLFALLRVNVAVEPSSVQVTDAGAKTVTQGRVVEYCGPEGLEIDVEEIVEVGDYFLEGSFGEGVENEGRIHGLRRQ